MLVRCLSLLPPVFGRLALAAVLAVLVAYLGLALAAPHFAPQSPNCPWSFALPGSSAPPAPPACPNVTRAAQSVAAQRGMPLPALLERAVAVTLAPLAAAVLLGVLVGVPIGAWSAARPRARLPSLLLGLSAAGTALPGFLISFGIVFAEIFWVDHTGHALIALTDYHFDLAHLVMPTLALACAPTALLAQTAAATFGTVYDQDYIRAARGRGIERFRLFAGHVLPVVAPQLLAAAASGAQLTLTTIPLLEYLFNWPGLGLLLLDAAESQDRTALAAALAIFAIAFAGLSMLATRSATARRAR